MHKVDRELILTALAQYDEGNPQQLLELNDQLETRAIRDADMIMAVSQNPVRDDLKLISNASLHQIISEDESLALIIKRHAANKKAQ